MAATANVDASSDLEAPGLVSDCRLMLSFARKNGFVLPQPLMREICWLDSVLQALSIAPVSQMAPQLIWPIELKAGQPVYPIDELDLAAVVPSRHAGLDGPPGLSPEQVILDVHSRLSVLIRPTTALSLQTSEPPAGKNHLFGGMPPLVQVVIVIAFFSAMGFVVSASKIASRAANATAAVAAASAAMAFTEAAASAAMLASPAGWPAAPSSGAHP